MPETVDDVTQTVRDLINNPRRLALLIRDEPASFSQVCSALNTLGDTEYAVEAYGKARNADGPGENYLLIYGILQVLFVQQDAAKDLARALNVKFAEDPVLQEIRTTRNLSIGHPTGHTSKKQRSFNVIDRGTMTKTSFNLRTRFADGTPPREQWVDVPSIVARQREGICCLLSAVVAELENREREHRMTFGGTRLQEAMPGVLDYYFEKMYQAVRDGSPEFGAMHVRLVQQAVDELDRLVKERDSAGGWDSFGYEFEQIRYPLAELLMYFTPASAGRLRAQDADIFISFAQTRMHALRSMAAEVDAEYARDPTDER